MDWCNKNFLSSFDPAHPRRHLLEKRIFFAEDRPTLKNVGFIRAAARFSKNHGFGSKDALDGVLGLSWAHFGCSWGLLGSSFGAFAGFRWRLHAQNFFLGPLPGQIYCFFFASSFAPVLEVFVFLIFEPLRVDFELPN